MLWALLLFGLAVLSLHKVGRVIEVGLQIASVAYGALLGVFLLGVLTRRANQTGAMVGMLCGFVAELYIWLGTRVPWTWYVAIGTVITFASWVRGKCASREEKHLTAKDAKDTAKIAKEINGSFPALGILMPIFASFAVSFASFAVRF